MSDSTARYARTIDEKRRSALLTAGVEIGFELAPDLSIGSQDIGFYNRKTKQWSEPER